MAWFVTAIPGCFLSAAELALIVGPGAFQILILFAGVPELGIPRLFKSLSAEPMSRKIGASHPSSTSSDIVYMYMDIYIYMYTYICIHSTYTYT